MNWIESLNPLSFRASLPRYTGTLSDKCLDMDPTSLGVAWGGLGGCSFWARNIFVQFLHRAYHITFQICHNLRKVWKRCLTHLNLVKSVRSSTHIHHFLRGNIFNLKYVSVKLPNSSDLFLNFRRNLFNASISKGI